VIALGVAVRLGRVWWRPLDDHASHVPHLEAVEAMLTGFEQFNTLVDGLLI
jgi:hypothetical protein